MLPSRENLGMLAAREWSVCARVCVLSNRGSQRQEIKNC
jgi:hypothetical protein